VRICYVVPCLRPTAGALWSLRTLLRSGAEVVVVRDVAKPKGDAGADPFVPWPVSPVLLKSGRLHLLEDGRAKGYTRSVNAGVRFCLDHLRADLICILNDDVRFLRGTAPTVGKLPTDAGLIGVLSNKAGYQSVLYSLDEMGDFTYPAVPFQATRQLFQDKPSIRGKMLPVPLVHGFCFFVAPEVIGTVGLLDEAQFPSGYGTDFDLSLRVEAAGLRNYVWTGEFVWHEGSATAGRGGRRIHTIGADFLLKTKHGARYPDAQMKTRVRLNKHLSNHLAFNS